MTYTVARYDSVSITPKRVSNNTLALTIEFNYRGRGVLVMDTDALYFDDRLELVGFSGEANTAFNFA
ncbi:hypothetical protein [Pseudohaliea sp.]|uniref:hypothetical protein n=1 Tax=Pseudohaliea sp. TaxID=2740289 RepID=UPI0032EB960F